RILECLIKSKIPEEAKHSLEWQTISIGLCCRIFNEICNPMSPIYQDKPTSQNRILSQAHAWLLKLWKGGCFAGHPGAYYKLVDKLMDLCPPSINESSQCVEEKNMQMLSLVSIAENFNGESKKMAKNTLAKWVCVICNNGIPS